MTNTWDQSKFLEPKCYPMTELETVQVLHSAWVSIFNSEPSIDSMGVLFAQWCLEVGIGAKYAKCYNFGNIKSSPTDGLCWTNFRCNEIIGGKEVWFDPPNDACKFRAFKTAAEGAVDYLKFLQRKNYANAWAQVIAGNPSEYAHQLKLSHYYTAEEKIYTAGVVSLFNQFKKKYGNVDLSTHTNPPDDKPIEPLFTPEELAHIQGQVASDLVNAANDYFATSRNDDGRDIDWNETNGIDVNDPIPMPQSVWSSLKNIFGGKK